MSLAFVDKLNENVAYPVLVWCRTNGEWHSHVGVAAKSTKRNVWRLACQGKVKDASEEEVHLYHDIFLMHDRWSLGSLLSPPSRSMSLDEPHVRGQAETHDETAPGNV
jgi:hypothetical protein